MTPEEYILRLIEASQKKYILLKDMLSITRVQSEAFREDGLDELERLIALKQAKIDEIGKLDEQFDVYYQRMKQELKVKSLEELEAHKIKGLKELQDIISAIMSTIKEISSLEAANSENANKMLQQFGEEIKRMSSSKKVSQAYGQTTAMQPPSYFIDKKK
ncbi:MAG: flagellar protein FlgN [Clostridia bacterium]|nr:flagellar protein FlgN [Clostridia bacterium]